MLVNVTVENLAPCKKLVRFEIDAAKVDQTFEDITTEYAKQAAIPGFRPGKAPRDRVAKQYEKGITDEARRRLINDSFQQGVKEQKLSVIGKPDLEEIQFGRGQALQFAATVEIAPQFELPEYRGLAAKRERSTVSDEDIQKALDALRDQKATFETVTRTIQEGDIAVVNYRGTCEGKPITDWSPTAKGLTEQKGFWIEVKPDAFIPGFSTQLIGAQAGDHRTVVVDFPADFVLPEVAGKKGIYEVEIVEVKIRVLPPLDDAFAKEYGAENLEALRAGVRSDLQNEVNVKMRRQVRNQLVEGLMSRVDFDLPESTVQGETNQLVYQIVSENHRRGISKEAIEKQKDDIYAAAARSAKDRVKLTFLFQEIAEKEGIRIEPQEIQARIVHLATRYKTTPDKMAKELQKQGGLNSIYQEVLHEKVLDFLQENARIEDIMPVAAIPAAT